MKKFKVGKLYDIPNKISKSMYWNIFPALVLDVKEFSRKGFQCALYEEYIVTWLTKKGTIIVDSNIESDSFYYESLEEFR